MKFTRHAREQMRRRGISTRHVEAALSTGRETWRKGALLVMHGTLRVIFCPFTGYVITAWWQRGRKKRAPGTGRGHRPCAGEKKKKAPAATGALERGNSASLQP